MVEPDPGSRGALSSRVHLPTARRAPGVTPRSAAGPSGREPETSGHEAAAPDSEHRADPGRAFSGDPSDPLLEKAQYRATEAAHSGIESVMRSLCDHRDQHFGNARVVRN